MIQKGQDISEMKEVWTHEDAYHQSFLMEISILLGFLNDYNLAVSRCYDQLLRVAIEVADGAAVEVKH